MDVSAWAETLCAYAHSVDLAALGALLADPTRASLLAALLDGRARTVSELARHGGIAVSTASEHLARLLDAGFVAVEPQGRHRYHRLAGADIAAALEFIHALSPTSVPAPRAPAALAFARTCYDHLAGTLAISLYEAVVERNDAGQLRLRDPSRLEALGVDLRRGTRTPLRSCLDWTERRHHLAGAVGASLLHEIVSRRWLVPGPSPRALRLTAAGRSGLRDAFGIDLGAVHG